MTLRLHKTGIEFPDGSWQMTAGNGLPYRNLIINGDMRIDQRNAGASVNTSSSTSMLGSFQLDRWKTFAAGTMVLATQQSSTAPAGFKNSNYYSVSTADASVAADSLYVIEQPIEGLNCANLGFGGASASTVTLSFWVRSSVTGTYCGSLTNSAENRAYIFTYTISAANTWEQKTVTIAGDTTGTWLTTNGIGLRVRFTLGAGIDFQSTANTWNSANVFATSLQTQLISTSGATFYITGVQLEVGDTATPFEHRPYDMELQRCQRYYEKSIPHNVGSPISQTGFSNMAYVARTTDNLYSFFYAGFRAEKRATPTIEIWSYNGTKGQISNADSGENIGAGGVAQPNALGFALNNQTGSAVNPQLICCNWTANAEL